MLASLAYRSPLMLATLLTITAAACDPSLAEESCSEHEGEDDDGSNDVVRMIAVSSVPSALPLPAPGSADDTAEYTALMSILIGGVTHDIRDLLAEPSGAVPRARITGAFRTTPTPVREDWSGVSNTSLSAAQIYRCQAGAWVFQRPEAGLVSLQVQPDGSVMPVEEEAFVLDHYRYPGVAEEGIAAGPAWRIVRRLSASGQVRTSVGAATQRYIGTTTSPDFVSVVNPQAPSTAINLLRVPTLTNGYVGSAVRGGFSANLPSGRGMLLRLSTANGRAPASCDVGQEGQDLRVPYATDYYFVQLVES